MDGYLIGGIGMSEAKIMMNRPQRLLKPIEVAETLSVSRAFAYQLMQQGKIRTVAIGGAPRVRATSLRRRVVFAH